MRTTRLILAIVALCLAGTPAARGQFTPGHVFVAGPGGTSEGCDFGDPEGIVEIDLVTGEITTFADCDDGINGINGLRFVPDASRLLALNAGLTDSPGWVQAFNPDGSSEIILDGSDGLVRPVGSNGLAFDRAGNLYVVDRALDAIVRFPTDGGPGTIFADDEDGINGFGGLAFAPNGDLFFAGPDASAIIRIAPDGESSVFDDTLGFPRNIAIDREGNIFVAQTSSVYRYDNGDPSAPSRKVL